MDLVCMLETVTDKKWRGEGLSQTHAVYLQLLGMCPVSYSASDFRILPMGTTTVSP
jgi:hypothetical protein